MAFHIVCLDDPAKPGLRQQVRAAHLEYMIAHQSHILFGGPLKAADGATSIGSAFALDYEKRDEVDAFLTREPYARAALFASIEVYPIAVMIPEARAGFLSEELERERGRPSNVNSVGD